MASTQVTLVHTDDATPNVAKYRISDKVGHTDALATVRTSGPANFIAAICMTLANTRLGAPVENLGAVCGISRCGAPGVMPLRVTALPWDFTGKVTFTEVGGGADRDVTVNVFTLVDPDGWI